MAKETAETQELSGSDLQKASDVIPAADEEQWETVRTGLGKEWLFPGGQPLVGFLVGAESVPLPDDPDRENARAFIFADVDTGEQLFLWESHELATALISVNVGDKVRISYLGVESFTGSDGPRQVKRYKVERARSAS